MEGFKQEKKQAYTDLSTVESSRNDLTAEEFPEGPAGADLRSETLGKSSPGYAAAAQPVRLREPPAAQRNPAEIPAGPQAPGGTGEAVSVKGLFAKA
jgi:hypothetical protein